MKNNIPTGPNCNQCGRPFLERNGDVLPAVKIEMQRRVIADQYAEISELRVALNRQHIATVTANCGTEQRLHTHDFERIPR